MDDGDMVSPGNGRRVQVRKVVRGAFTDAKRQAFLDHLAGCANVTRSARAAGVGISTVYDARRRDPVFAQQWEEAMDAGYATLEALLIERAALGGAVGAYTPGDTAVPGPETIDTWLALELLRLRNVPKAGRKGPGPKPGRASEKALADELCRRLDAIQRGKQGKKRKGPSTGSGKPGKGKQEAGPRPSPES